MRRRLRRRLQWRPGKRRGAARLLADRVTARHHPGAAAEDAHRPPLALDAVVRAGPASWRAGR